MPLQWLRRLRPEPARDPAEAAIDRIIEAEGGFSNHKSDRGGATRYGITARTLSDWRGRAVETDDVRNLSLSEARTIYRRRYFDAGNVAALPEESWVDALDAMVNHGVRGGARLVQRACNEAGAGLKVDGLIGPRTASAVAGMGAWRFREALCSIRVSHYEAICRADPAQTVFLAGWKARIGKIRGMKC